MRNISSKAKNNLRTFERVRGYYFLTKNYKTMYKTTKEWFTPGFKWSENWNKKLSPLQLAEIHFYNHFQDSMYYLNGVKKTKNLLNEGIGEFLVPTKYGQLDVRASWDKKLSKWIFRQFMGDTQCEFYGAEHIAVPKNIHEIVDCNKFSWKWNIFSGQTESDFDLIIRNATEIAEIQKKYFIEPTIFTYNGEMYPCEGTCAAVAGDVVVCLESEYLELGVVLATYDNDLRVDVDGVNDIRSYRLATKIDIEKWLSSEVSQKSNSSRKLAAELRKQI